MELLTSKCTSLLSLNYRKRPAGGRVRGSDASNQPGTQDGTSQAIGAPDANAELATTLHVSFLSIHRSSCENYRASFVCNYFCTWVLGCIVKLCILGLEILR